MTTELSHVIIDASGDNYLITKRNDVFKVVEFMPGVRYENDVIQCIRISISSSIDEVARYYVLPTAPSLQITENQRMVLLYRDFSAEYETLAEFLQGEGFLSENIDDLPPK